MVEMSQYQAKMIDEMPSRIWKRLILDKANSIAKHTPLKSVDRLLSIKNFKDVAFEIVSLLEYCKTIEEQQKIKTLYDVVSVLYALYEAFEFVIDIDTLRLMQTLSIDDMREFSMPFEGMLINFKQGDKYLSDFVHIIHMEEKFNKDGQKHDMYTVKICAVSQGNGKLTYGIVTEALFTPAIAHRLLLDCNFAGGKCPYYIEYSLNGKLSTMGVDNIPIKDEPICLRTLRTIDMCNKFMPELDNSVLYSAITVGYNVLNYIRTRPVLRKQAGIPTKREIKEGVSKRPEQQRPIGERFIDLTKPIARYARNVVGSEEGMGGKGTHASPRQHLRRGHIRRLRSGKAIWVRECVVNADKDEKVVYRIDSGIKGDTNETKANE